MRLSAALKAAFSLLFAMSAVLSAGPEFKRYEQIAPAVPLYGPPDTVSMFVIGDVMLHSKQMEYPYTQFLAGIKGLMQSADVTVANMEFTLAGEPYTGYPEFSAPDEYADYAADCGVNVFLTANNHIMDKGRAGLERTLEVYRNMENSKQIRFVGTSTDEMDELSRNPLIINVRGIRIAFLNFTYGTNAPMRVQTWPKVNRIDTTDIHKALTRAKERKADFILAFPHWGEEYALEHSEAQENLAHWLVKNGVNAIIGAHPHVIQDSTVIGGVPIFYSVGNAVSNMSAANTQLELGVGLKFVRDENGDRSMLSPSVSYLWCSRPGKFIDNYATIVVKEHIGTREKWMSPPHYDKMMATYSRVKSATGVQD